MGQTVAEGQSVRMVPDLEEHMEQKCVIEFLQAEKTGSPPLVLILISMA